MLCFVTRGMGSAKTCPRTLRCNHQQDTREIRRLLNELLRKYNLSLRVPNSRMRQSVKTSSHFTGHISEALSKLWLRPHYPSGIMSTPTQKEEREYYMHLPSTSHPGQHPFLLSKQRPQRPGPACQRQRKSSKRSCTVAYSYISSPNWVQSADSD